MMKFCILVALLGVASAGVKIYKNEAKECEVDMVSTFTNYLNEKYKCPAEYMHPAKTSGRYYCEDPSCPTSMHDFYEDNYDYKLVCCQERCDTYDCNGAWMKNNSCKATYKALTKDFGQTWHCKESFYPKCPGGDVKPCDSACRQYNPNNTITLFGEELWCDALSCTVSGNKIYEGIMVLDEENWSWRCVNKKKCSTGDFMMKAVNISSIDGPQTVWRCISETCPTEKHKYDERRESMYCQADLDCISEALSWNYKNKNWDCPSDRNKTTIESKLDELIAKVNEIDQKVNTLMKKK